MMKQALAAAAAVLLAVAPAWAQQGHDRSGRSAADQQFLKEAVQGNMAEVQMGRLASERGQHETVKMFGRWMASTHGFVNRELATAIQQMHGQTPPSTLTSEAQSMMQKLQGLTGEQFDRAYLRAMVEDHQKDLEAYRKEAQNGQDRFIKTFAQNFAPAIQEHLQQAQDLQQDLFNVGPKGMGAAANATVQGAAGSTQPAK